MKTSFLALLFLSLLNCGPTEVFMEDLTPQLDMTVKEKPDLSTNIPDLTQKIEIKKDGRFYYDPLLDEYCENRTDLINQNPSLVGKCLPIKTTEAKAENTCQGVQKRLFLEGTGDDKYLSKIRYTEQDGKFYKVLMIQKRENPLYNGSYYSPAPTSLCNVMSGYVNAWYIWPDLDQEVKSSIFSNLP